VIAHLLEHEMADGNLEAAARRSLLQMRGLFAFVAISTSDPDVLSQGYKFFIFHRPSVGYEEAYADIAECRSFLPAGPGRTLPGFTPWVAAPPPRRPVQGANPYGLVGDAILAIILPKMVRGQDNTIMRRCMETRGYVRFAVAEDLLDDLNEGEESMITARLARLASGPRPTQPEVSE
jgi:hypothetical protein